MAHLTVDGVRLHFEDRGSGPGPALVLLHSTGTSGRVWDAQFAELARDHRLIALDSRGCGRSDRPAHGNDIATNTADVLALLDALDLNRPLLVGSSIGATFALEAALAAPGRVGGIVSVDGPGYWPGEAMADQLDAMVTTTDRAAQFADWVPQWYGPDARRELIEDTIRQVTRSSAFIDALFTEAAAYDPRPRMGELTVPALFLHGALDGSIPYEVSRVLAGLAPRGTFRLVEGSGHMAHQERPAAVNAALREAARGLYVA